MNQNIFKMKYDKLRMQLFTYKGKLEANLITDDINNTARNITLTRNQNEVPQLEFDMPFTKERKINVVDGCERLIRFLDWYYIIKSTRISDGSKKEIHVVAKGEQEELKYCYCKCINQIGASVKECFDSVFNSTTHPIDAGYVFLGTDIPDSKRRHLTTENEASIYQNLMSICDVFQCWLEFSLTGDGKKGIFFRSKDIEDGKRFKTGIDLKELEIEYDSSEIFTRLLPYGASDELTGNPLTIMEVNPTHKSYVENYSYYLGVLGVPENIVDREAKYQNIKIWTDDTIIDANYLYEMAQQELSKCCIPTLDATLTISDLSKLLDTSIVECRIGQSVMALNKKLGFRIKFRITGIEENFNNPLDTKITISNKINIDTNIQNINHTCDVVDGVTSTNSPSGDPYVPMNKVLDGDHWNVVQRFDQQYSLATQTYNNINLKVEETGKSIAQLDIKADQITSSVEEITDGVKTAKSEIRQTARKISAVVEEGEESGSWELSKDAFKVAFSGITNDITTIDGQGILCHNADGSYTRLGSKGLEHLEDGMSKPYHYLTWSYVYEGLDAGTDYEEHTFTAPSEFQKFDPEDVSISVSVAKANDSNDGEDCLLYWTGVYGYIVGHKGNLKINLQCLACWREPIYDSNDNSRWIEEFDAPRSGKMNVQVVLTA